MSEEEKPLEVAARSILKLLLFPLAGFEEAILRLIPKELEQSTIHMINSRIEFLKAINALLNKRIRSLEKLRGELEEKELKKRKEKTVVE
ncbi:MAG: hypothetical protein ACE5GD_11420 [Candidatus Geothermarchaeales archaeon]